MTDYKNILDEQPWVEKYRPQSLSDIASQTLTVKSLQEFVKKKSIPHLIFAGPAGTGKTSAAWALIYDLIGRENLRQDLILERNASDDVRMDTRDEIKNFVSYSSMGEKDQFKFVILDEADNISKDMQGAFRRIIEMAPPTVKFIFMCNYVERLIDPLLSRCAIFRFYPLPPHDFYQKISRIASLEGFQIQQDVLDAILFISNGDLRRAINLLQTVVANNEQIASPSAKSPIIKISPDIIYKISGFLSTDEIASIMNLLFSQKFQKAVQIFSNISAISSRAFFRQVTKNLLDKKLPFPILEKMLISLGEFDYRLTLEADEFIQCTGLLASIIKELEVGS